MKNFFGKLKNTFEENSDFKVFLISILISGLSYGLYKGMPDNFLAEIVGMGEMDRGITEFFRELPGIMPVFILAAFCMLSAETLYKAGLGYGAFVYRLSRFRTLQQCLCRNHKYEKIKMT